MGLHALLQEYLYPYLYNYHDWDDYYVLLVAHLNFIL
jgi:hypothetical protein